jgi:hypothetical protein
MPVPAAFSDYLKASNIDEATLGIPDNLSHKREDRRRQLLAFHQQALADPPPPVAKDSTGAEVKIGDTVTITLVVTGIHAVPDDYDRGLVGRTYLNLARVVEGVELHQFSYATDLVKKAEGG